MKLSKSSKKALISSVQHIYVRNINSTLTTISNSWAQLLSDKKEIIAGYDNIFVLRDMCIHIHSLLTAYRSMKTNIKYIRETINLSKTDMASVISQEKAADFIIFLSRDFVLWLIETYVNEFTDNIFRLIEQNLALYNKCGQPIKIPNELETLMVARKLSI